jgi:hypothetical protein
VADDAVGKIMGVPEHFSWAGLVANGLANGVGGEFGPSPDDIKAGISGSGFDNVMSVATGDVVRREVSVALGDQHVPSWEQVGEDVAGNILGNVGAYGIKTYEQYQAQKAQQAFVTKMQQEINDAVAQANQKVDSSFDTTIRDASTRDLTRRIESAAQQAMDQAEVNASPDFYNQILAGGLTDLAQAVVHGTVTSAGAFNAAKATTAYAMYEVSSGSVGALNAVDQAARFVDVATGENQASTNSQADTNDVGYGGAGNAVGGEVEASSRDRLTLAIPSYDPFYAGSQSDTNDQSSHQGARVAQFIVNGNGMDSGILQPTDTNTFGTNANTGGDRPDVAPPSQSSFGSEDISMLTNILRDHYGFKEYTNLVNHYAPGYVPVVAGITQRVFTSAVNLASNTAIVGTLAVGAAADKLFGQNGLNQTNFFHSGTVALGQLNLPGKLWHFVTHPIDTIHDAFVPDINRAAELSMSNTAAGRYAYGLALGDLSFNLALAIDGGVGALKGGIVAGRVGFALGRYGVELGSAGGRMVFNSLGKFADEWANSPAFSGGYRSQIGAVGDLSKFRPNVGPALNEADSMVGSRASAGPTIGVASREVGVQDTALETTAPPSFTPYRSELSLNFEMQTAQTPSGTSITVQSNQTVAADGRIVDQGSTEFPSNQLRATFNSQTGNLNIDWLGASPQQSGLGTEMVSRAIEQVGPANVTSISGDLDASNEGIYDYYYNELGYSSQDALQMTPAAKIRSTLGYSNVGFNDNGQVVGYRVQN